MIDERRHPAITQITSGISIFAHMRSRIEKAPRPHPVEIGPREGENPGPSLENSPSFFVFATATSERATFDGDICYWPG